MKPWAYITLGVVATLVGLLVISIAASVGLGNATAALQVVALLGGLIAFAGVLACLVGVIGEGVRIGNRASEID